MRCVHAFSFSLLVEDCTDLHRFVTERSLTKGPCYLSRLMQPCLSLSLSISLSLSLSLSLCASRLGSQWNRRQDLAAASVVAVASEQVVAPSNCLKLKSTHTTGGGVVAVGGVGGRRRRLLLLLLLLLVLVATTTTTTTAEAPSL